MKVIAFDPGGTTGWITYQDGQLSRHGELDGQHHQRLDHLLLNWSQEGNGPYYVIYERFDNRNADFAKLVSLEYIGVIKRFVQAYQLYAIPQGSDVKNFSTNDKIKAAGWYIPYKEKHAMDAARHLFSWLVNGAHEYDEYRTKLLQQMKLNLK